MLVTFENLKNYWANILTKFGTKHSWMDQIAINLI